MELLALSIGIGLAVSLLCTELFGIASAGLIVPGYFALYIQKPMAIVATLAVALVTFAVVRLLSTILVVYGRRRTALMILFAFIFGMLLRHWTGVDASSDHAAIGFIIPGLIAIWIDRQSVVQTLSSLVVVTVIVRLLLILTMGSELV